MALGIVIRTVVTAASLWVATVLVPGVSIVPPAGEDYLVALLISAVVFGLLNAVVRPILFVLSLPITCMTLGLFVLVLNGLMIVLLSLVPFTGFHVDGLFSAIVAGLAVGITSFVLNKFVPG